jgi:hypothetical protein
MAVKTHNKALAYLEECFPANSVDKNIADQYINFRLTQMKNNSPPCIFITIS